MDFWAQLTSIPESNNLVHHYLVECDMPFSPELIYLFILNINQESFKKLDDSIDEYALLNYQVTENKIVLLTATKTKKILMVQPKFFLVLRVI